MDLWGWPVLGLVGWPADVLAAVAVLAAIAVHVPCRLAGSIVSGRHVAAAATAHAVAAAATAHVVAGAALQALVGAVVLVQVVAAAVVLGRL